MRYFFLALLAVAVLGGCGKADAPKEPLPPCCSLSAQERGMIDCDATPSAPVCNPQDPPPDTNPVPAVDIKNGYYEGKITLVSYSGPDTSRCYLTPIGTYWAWHNITINKPSVQERLNPCEVIDANPSSFHMVCVNHNTDEVGKYGTETRDFHLTFDASGTVLGTVVDTRDWGGCSVRSWNVQELFVHP